MTSKSSMVTAAQTPAALVQERLERMIAAGDLSPGERLNEVALAKNFSVTRGPIREAARALEKLGLVTIIPNRGAFVRECTLDEAMDIYELNALIFGLAAAQAAQSIDAARAKALIDLVDAMDVAAAGGDTEVFFELNIQFHKSILDGARNEQIAPVYLGFIKKLALLRRAAFRHHPNMAASNAEHRHLLEAILAGDAETAQKFASKHGAAGRARLLAALARD
jgi:DNA-binding GntR family transcriptional regulator